MPDSIPITITAKTMEGLGAVDPEVTVQISEVTPISQPISTATVRNFATSATSSFPLPRGFQPGRSM